MSTRRLSDWEALPLAELELFSAAIAQPHPASKLTVTAVRRA